MRKYIKKIMVAMFFLIMVAGFIFSIPFFIPGTPKYSLNQYYYGISKGDGSILSRCWVENYKDSLDVIEKQYLIYAFKDSMTMDEKEKELKRVKDKLGDEFDYLTLDDVVRYKVNSNDDGIFFMNGPSLVILIRNEVYPDKSRWLIVP